MKNKGEKKQKATRGRSMRVNSTQSRKGVKGQLPLAGSRDSVPCGVWGNAPTVPRPTNSKEATYKGAGSEASLPVTLRFLRSAPQAALFNVYAVSRRWRDRTACLSDMAACFRKQGFRACGRESGALRSPPTPLRSAHPCSLTVIVGWEKRNCPPSAPQSFPHADAPDSQTAPPAPGTAAHRPSAPQTG